MMTLSNCLASVSIAALFLSTPVSAAPLIGTNVMRDIAACRGADGWWYLAGTTAEDQPSDGLIFANNHGISIWKSQDMTDWALLGQAWDLVSNVFPVSACQWQGMRNIRPGVPDGVQMRGVSAPEIHYVCSNYYIAFSLTGQGTGLLRSKTGEPEGPYEQVAHLTVRYDDASLFEEGTNVYWLWGGGWIARLMNDLSALAERPRLLQPGPDGPLGVYPLQVGARGAFMFKKGGVYHLTAIDFVGQDGASKTGIYVATATNI